MDSSTEAVEQALAGTRLQGRSIRQRWTDGSNQPCLLMAADPHEPLVDWECAHDLLALTGRYPILTDDGDLIAASSPVAHVPPLDDPIEDWIDSIAAEIENTLKPLDFAGAYRSTLEVDDLDGSDTCAAHVLSESLRRFGAAPSLTELRALRAQGALPDDEALEHWLMRWECDQFGESAHQPAHVSHLDWTDLGPHRQLQLALLPTAYAWAALYYVGWWGLEGDDDSMVVTKLSQISRWQGIPGARLVYADLTTLGFEVRDRPGDLQQAFQLAVTHDRMASSGRVMRGISLRDHARALLASHRWRLFDRP